jgi:plasmid stabilization system protein ParE
MTARIPFSYVQARAQARLATLPCDAEWERLEATRSLSAFLEEARATALKSWVAGLSGVSDAHDIDRAIRALFRAEVETAARWVPARWQAAVRWVQWLPQLPVLDRALRSGEAPSWMANDSFLASFVGSGGDVDPAALQQAGLGELVSAAAADDDLPQAWVDGWRRRWPSAMRSVRRGLEAVVSLLADPQRRFLETDPARTWPLRRELDRRLRHQFHVSLLQPAGLFVYLALYALGLERLRAALVGRALFPPEAVH